MLRSDEDKLTLQMESFPNDFQKSILERTHRKRLEENLEAGWKTTFSLSY